MYVRLYLNDVFARVSMGDGTLLSRVLDIQSYRIQFWLLWVEAAIGHMRAYRIVPVLTTCVADRSGINTWCVLCSGSALILPSFSSPALFSSAPLACGKMIVTADGLYYSQYIKHFRGSREGRVGEIYGRDDVARRGSPRLFLRPGRLRDVGVTLWYNRSITASDDVSLSVDSARFWSRWTYARSIFWPQEMAFSWR